MRMMTDVECRTTRADRDGLCSRTSTSTL
jgi:hypothetical protein